MPLTLCARALRVRRVGRRLPERAAGSVDARALACEQLFAPPIFGRGDLGRRAARERGAEKSSVLCVAISRVCRGARPSFLVVYTCSLNVITRAVVNLTRIFILISPRPSLLNP